MKNNSQFSGMLRAIYAHWPAYALAYGGMVLSLIVIGVSIARGWVGLVPLSLAFFILLAYFLSASFWSAHLLFDPGGLVPHHVLFDMGQLRATDTFVTIDLGLRYRAMDVAQRLTTGKAVVVDVYNPQWTAGQALARYRSRMPAPPPDPRIEWQNGRINLLPLPDKSVTAVILCQTISQFWQEGDQLQLLREIYRILSENGRVLLAERTRTQTNWLLMGPAVLTLQPAGQWHHLLRQAGFRIRSAKELQGVIHCVRADKPTYTEAQQLSLNIC